MDDDERADRFLHGERMTFEEADALWRRKKDGGDIPLARSLLARIRHEEGCLSDGIPTARPVRDSLCCEEALLTSKDPELGASVRHDAALELLRDRFDIDSPDPKLDGEVLGIAGGILKRKWQDLGQAQDLRAAARLYAQGAEGPLGDDAYNHINAAFLDDLLAIGGDDAEARRARATRLRERIVDLLPATNSWWNAATRAEALFGLGRYVDARRAIAAVKVRPEPWKLQTTVRQLGQLASLREKKPMEVPELRDFFAELIPGRSVDVAASATLGKVGLALSGGGFRASFYHLGVLARLAELDVLRHVEVLSCVSGGSIVGACYWLMLRRRMLDPQPMTRADYVSLVRDLITHFQNNVDRNLVAQVKPALGEAFFRLLGAGHGALNPEDVAPILENWFYRPLMTPAPGRDKPTIWMHELPFTPADHQAADAGPAPFNPGLHNWMRAHKVPALVINATTVNTGHAWQFTPTWMGESPWAIHEAADAIPRLEWGRYEPEAGWCVSLARAVAASACVPGVFMPLELETDYYSDAAQANIRVQLADGGVHDNQGTVALLAQNCNVILVSDACGQLRLQAQAAAGAGGLKDQALRAMDTLMERVRLANYSDLAARQRTGLIRGLMFLHMKAGLDADVIRRKSAQDAYALRRQPLSPLGLRKDLQQAVAELRTHLNVFTGDESNALMASGYQMTAKSFETELGSLPGLSQPPMAADWPFLDMLATSLSSTRGDNPQRTALLVALRAGR